MKTSLRSYLVKFVLLLTCACITSLNAAKNVPIVSENPPADSNAQVFTITNLIAQADVYVGKQVVLEGMATWVCPHRGCKAQLVNADGASKTALLVTQGKGMAKFTPEQKGDTLRVTGILHETRITAADLDKQEEELKNPTAKADAHDHDHAKAGSDCADCPTKNKPVDPEIAAKAKQAQLNRIAKNREMLSKSKKGYLSSFSFEGQTWAKVD